MGTDSGSWGVFPPFSSVWLYLGRSRRGSYWSLKGLIQVCCFSAGRIVLHMVVDNLSEGVVISYVIPRGLVLVSSVRLP